MTLIDRIAHLKGPLTITCLTCRHAQTWTPAEAQARLGPACTVPRAKRRLACSRCGERRSAHIAFSASRR